MRKFTVMFAQLYKWCLFLLADVFIAFIILFAHYEYPRHLVSLDQGTDLPVWLDVTPGSPKRIPLFFEMLYSPLPLPREQNVSAIAGVVIEPDQPVILKGRPNSARYWSFAFYPRENTRHSRALPSIDSFQVRLEPDGSYVVIFSPPPSPPPSVSPPEAGGKLRGGEGRVGAKNWVNTGDSRRGIIFLRTYVPTPGSRLRLPAISYGDQLVTPEEEWDHGP